MNDDKQIESNSYLLHLRREGSQSPWRALLRSTATEKLDHFADGARLRTFIQTLLATGSEIEQDLTEGNIR
jgi:hypothetical protein